jgi:hypothetical protein
MLTSEAMGTEPNPASLRRRDAIMCLTHAAQARKAVLLARRSGTDAQMPLERAHECLRRAKHYGAAARHLGWRLPGQ